MNIRINGKCYSHWTESEGEVEEEIYSFLGEWYNDSPYVAGHTSGSTGVPRDIQLLKEDMRASARITNVFLNITSGSVLLLCLSVGYIAGKMMIVRALEAGAELITASVCSHPLAKNLPPVDLAAMVPMQVAETLRHPVEAARLGTIRRLLIGGAPVSPSLEAGLQALPTVCYVTYGMTETVSHVALRKLGWEEEYCALGKVTFSTDQRGCLVIRAPHLQHREFVTNDLVALSDATHFRWIGRLDHVINSGGIKYFPEVLENKISALIRTRFFITSRPDEQLGQCIVLAVEAQSMGHGELETLLLGLYACLHPHEMPRVILGCAHFRETSSGKLIRSLQGLPALMFWCAGGKIQKP